MKIAVNTDLNRRVAGPLVFSKRLFERLEAMGVRIVERNQKPDVYFAIISYNRWLAPRGAKNVLRLDGIYWNGNDPKDIAKNKAIFKSARHADGVVFQSDFCLRCCTAQGVTPNSHTVIFNGIDQAAIAAIEPADLDHAPAMVACAEWRVTKRPQSICRGFLAADVPHTLYMIGPKPDDAIEHERIVWTGPLAPTESLAITRAATHAIHLAKFDPCPNTVVEQLSCGLPVLHTANGGTPELVGDRGVMMPVDRDWDYAVSTAPIDNLDPASVAEHIQQLAAMPRHDPPAHLDLGPVAQQYHDYFQKILEA